MLFLTGIQDHYVSEEINKMLHKGFCNQKRKKIKSYLFNLFIPSLNIFMWLCLCPF